MGIDFKIEQEHLKRQLALFEEIIFAISPDKIGYSELTSVVGPTLKFNLDTGRSIQLLAEHKHLRDLVILTRPFVECMINVGFICAKGAEAVLKSKKYAYQKGYRDLFRELKINEFEIVSGLKKHKDLIDPYRCSHLIQALEEYSTTKGKEKASWTEETTKEKLEFLAEKYGIGVTGYLSFAFFTVYRDVSEIIHGSYYGIRIFTGMQQKEMTAFKSAEEAAEYFTSHQFKLAALTIQQVCVSVAAIIEILDYEFSSIPDINSIKLRSKDEMNKYTDAVGKGGYLQES